jgi:hypothetical protein
LLPRGTYEVLWGIPFCRQDCDSRAFIRPVKPKHNNFPLLYVKVTVSHREEYGWITPPWYINTIITRKRAVNAKQIKDEIRKLSRTDKNEIYKWIDERARGADLLSRIGVYRSLEIRQGLEQKWRVIS